MNDGEWRCPSGAATRCRYVARLAVRAVCAGISSLMRDARKARAVILDLRETASGGIIIDGKAAIKRRISMTSRRLWQDGARQLAGRPSIPARETR